MPKLLKGMFELVIATPLAGVTLQQIGAAGLGAIGDATQSFVSLGILSKGAELFKFK